MNYQLRGIVLIVIGILFGIVGGMLFAYSNFAFGLILIVLSYKAWSEGLSYINRWNKLSKLICNI